jgi:hypothetical protein
MVMTKDELAQKYYGKDYLDLCWKRQEIITLIRKGHLDKAKDESESFFGEKLDDETDKHKYI